MKIHKNIDPLQLLNYREAAELLSVSPRTLWALAKSGKVPSLRIGKQVRFRRSTLAELLAALERKGA